MRILLTGDDGYIGSEMARVLRAAGHEVHGLDAGYYRNCHLGPPADSPPVTPDQHPDVRDVAVTDVEGFEAVIHLAALCNDPLGDLNPAWTHDINHRATVKLATLAKQAGVERFLLASSCSVYGDAGTADELTETTKPHPLTPYAVSKARSEADVARLADSTFSPVFFRNGSVYGVSPRFRADIVLNNLICWAVTTGKVTILSDGSPWRPLVHVEDVAAVFALMLTAPRDTIHNQIFNVGVTGENYQVRQLAGIVSETVPGSEVIYTPHAGGDARDYRVSFDKLRRVLPEFEPRWTVRMGARQVYDGVRRAGMTFAEFQGPRYTRLARLRQLLDADCLDQTLRIRPVALPMPC